MEFTFRASLELLRSFDDVMVHLHSNPGSEEVVATMSRAAPNYGEAVVLGTSSLETNVCTIGICTLVQVPIYIPIHPA